MADHLLSKGKWIVPVRELATWGGFTRVLRPTLSAPVGGSCGPPFLGGAASRFVLVLPRTPECSWSHHTSSGGARKTQDLLRLAQAGQLSPAVTAGTS